MALIPWNSFRDLDRFREDATALRGDADERSEDDFVPFFPALRMKMPTVDVSETEKDVVVEMETPGVDPKNIELSIEGNRLSVRGRAEEKQEEKNKSYYRKEIRKDAFERSVALPSEVKAEEASASYKDGMLKVVIPKAEAVKPKRIEVRVK